MTDHDVERLLQDEGIIRNRMKIEAIINNARAVLHMQKQQTLAEFFWSYVNGVPLDSRIAMDEDVPASTPLSHRISKDLKAHKFRFTGPTIIYAHMQATGIVNDHEKRCFRHDQVHPH